MYFQGNYFQVGDIVSVLDEDDGHVYYGQLRGFLQDQYMELSGIITWLLPTTASPPDRFDPATFILGLFLYGNLNLLLIVHFILDFFYQIVYNNLRKMVPVS